MNITYEISGPAGSDKPEKYFVEIIFENAEATFQAKLPFLIIAPELEIAQNVLEQLQEQLFQNYCLKITGFPVLQPLLTEEAYRRKEFALQDHFKGMDNAKIGTLTFDTLITGTLTPADQRPQKGKRFERKLQYPIIKNGKTKSLYPPDDFLVINITIQEKELPAPQQKEATLEEIQSMMRKINPDKHTE